ncbi:hypothetical protein BEWA_033420 [Theileria equi strain WA]|uniref:Uncharacterized protein n=1 Tax=Theileria equi strain WA TaxID=1537102 RepID=L0B039_THEEQ|nr:hypothetical protein BEWA_033420 [Theileria equi strain WA]AFZ80489.1 hypothetical protein BEWA_033420 [Theileria equi strain WA]|eukprot:XP_004830155.1 hypothetical protein BEWA_033420 [Theileria equi strain WA]
MGETNDRFYYPDSSLHDVKEDVLPDVHIEAQTGDWHTSSTFKESNSLGSLLSNELPWQVKWYLKLNPSKSPEELRIDPSWSYETPKLETFMGRRENNSPEITLTLESGKTHLQTLKTISSCILSGVTQESLKAQAFNRSTEKKTSDDGTASILSAQFQMPSNEDGKTKHSILESLNIANNKKTKAGYSRK